MDDKLLVEAASAWNVTIELLRAVGEFVPRRDAARRPRFGPIDETTLRAAVALADERPIEQDPAFAIRIIVDTAIRALSPAVNDPTTAVLGLDALEVVVRELGGPRPRAARRDRRRRSRPAGLALPRLGRLARSRFRPHGMGLAH